MKLSFKFVKPWTWNCLKRKPKQVMIPVTAAAIAEVLYADDDLYEQVTDDLEELAIDDEEEEEEPPGWVDEMDSSGNIVNSTLDDELIDGYVPDFATSVAEQIGESSVSMDHDVTQPVTIGDLIQSQMKHNDTRTTREKFDAESG